MAQEWKSRKREAQRVDTARKVMEGHGKRYATLTMQQKETLDARASLQSAARAHDRQESVAHLSAEIDIVQRRLQQELGQPQPQLQLSTCRFSALQKELLAAYVQTGGYSQKRVQDLRVVAQQPPRPLSAQDQATLEAQAVWHMAPLGEKPTWLPKVCRHRHLFRDVALIFQLEESFASFKFLYAVQNPQQAFFSPLQQVVAVSPCMPTMEVAWYKEATCMWQHSFRILWDQVLPAEALPSGSDVELWVLPYLMWTSDNRVVSDADLIAWSDLDDLVLDPRESRSTTGPRRTTAQTTNPVPTALAEKFPWLSQPTYTTSSSASPWHSSATSAQQTPAAPTRDIDPDASEPASATNLTDDDLEDIFKELEQKRQECQVDGTRRGYDFKTSLLGGAWLQAKEGRAYDAFKAEARTPTAKQWCTLFSVPRSARFDVRLHGERGASVLSLSWAQKMQYFFDLWLNAGSPETVQYSEADIAGFVESQDFLDFIEGAEGKTLERAQQIRDLLPRQRGPGASASSGQ